MGSDPWYVFVADLDDSRLLISLYTGSTYSHSLDDDSLTLYISTHSSDMRIFSLFMTENNDGKAQFAMKRNEHRALTQKLRRLHQDYDRRENLGGLSIMKTWGLASIPNDSLLSACISIRPGDMPEYVTRSMEKSIVVFASDTSEDQLDTFPWQGIPAVWDVRTTQSTILEAILGYASFANRTPSDFSSRIEDAATAVVSFLDYEKDSEKTTLEEVCAICDSIIPLESLTEASCLHGHQCSKSFHYHRLRQPLRLVFST